MSDRTRVLLAARTADLAPSIIREMSARRRASSIDLSLGQPSLPADRDLLERAYARLCAGPDGYTENAGLLELRTLIATHYALPERRGAENVLVTVGSEGAVFLAIASAIDPGDEVLYPEPGYPAYRGIIQFLGGVAVPYPLDRARGLRVRADVIASKVTKKTRAIMLNSPSNPFGSIDEAADLEAIAKLAEREGLVVLSDEIYRDLVYDDGDVPSIAGMTSRSLFVSGLSKSCAFTGYRLGYLIADASFVKKATLAQQLMVTCAPRLSQLMAIEVFRAPERLRAHVPHYRAARERLLGAASALPDDARLHLGGGAFYAVLDVSRYANGDPLKLALELLDAEDVVVVPGTAFGPSGDWFWRMSYAAGAEAAGEGLTRIARFLRAR